MGFPASVNDLESTVFFRQKDENFCEDWHFRAISCRIKQQDLVLKLKMAAWLRRFPNRHIVFQQADLEIGVTFRDLHDSVNTVLSRNDKIGLMRFRDGDKREEMMR